jgi:hypothetical protein
MLCFTHCQGLQHCLTLILATATAAACFDLLFCLQARPASVRPVRPVLVRAGGDLGDQASQAARDAQKNVSPCCLNFVTTAALTPLYRLLWLEVLKRCCQLNMSCVLCACNSRRDYERHLAYSHSHFIGGMACCMHVQLGWQPPPPLQYTGPNGWMQPLTSAACLCSPASGLAAAAPTHASNHLPTPPSGVPWC